MALVIGAEGLSQIVDWTDRTTAILFGDGAGAAIIKKDEKARFETVMHSDGSMGGALTCENSIQYRGINDSKKISEKKREKLYDDIMNVAIAVGIGISDVDVIEKVNILKKI